MGKTHDHISDELRQFILAQHVFFVATAPLAASGHVNLSPKGLDTLRVLSERQVAYLDLTGSGNETSAHLWENGRITLMFCAFAAKPKILRVYGRGRVVLPGEAAWPQFAAHFPTQPGTRQVIVIDVTRVQTSCGFGVPLMDFTAEREALTQWTQAKGDAALAAYRREHNARSIDGLRAPLESDR